MLCDLSSSQLRNEDLVDTEIPLVIRFVIYFFTSASKSVHFGAYTQKIVFMLLYPLTIPLAFSINF